jgi:hypothetical protein
LRLRADSATAYRFSAVATLAAAVAGITMLAGLVRLRLFDGSTRSLISIDAIQDAAVLEWLNVVLALVVTLLVMAAASALVALFAHATTRRYEVALRAVVGATRKRITREQLRKAAANVAITLAVGVPLGLSAAWLANRTWPAVSTGPRPVEWIALSVAFTAVLAVLVAWSAAARMARAGWLGDVLAPEARTNPGYGAEDLRTALLHLQFAFTFALLVTALLVWQQARATSDRVEANGPVRYVSRVAMSEHATARQRRELHQQLEKAGYRVASPGVLIGVGATDRIVSNCGRCGFANMLLPMFPLRTQRHVVGTGFFAGTGLPLRYGREFEATDAAARNVVVNDTFANLAFQGQHAIGKTILVGGLRGTWYTVIGVVKDLPISGLISFKPDERSIVKSNVPGREPAIYFYRVQDPPSVVDVIGDAPVQPTIADLSSTPVQTLANLQAQAHAPANWFARVLSALAAAAVIIAVLSLGALTLLNVRQRELEIAAHRAVGARRRDILIMIVKASLLTGGRGTVAGIILSVALARAIQMVLPEMKIFDAGAIAITAALLACAAIVAAILPAHAAARVMPARIHA